MYSGHPRVSEHHSFWFVEEENTPEHARNPTCESGPVQAASAPSTGKPMRLKPAAKQGPRKQAATHVSASASLMHQVEAKQAGTRHSQPFHAQSIAPYVSFTGMHKAGRKETPYLPLTCCQPSLPIKEHFAHLQELNYCPDTTRFCAKDQSFWGPIFAALFGGQDCASLVQQQFILI
jgi:hypothetical protein